MALPDEIGKRIKLLSTNDPYTRLKKGDEGIIQDITELPESTGGHRQIWIKWQDGSRLCLLDGYDKFEILD